MKDIFVREFYLDDDMQEIYTGRAMICPAAVAKDMQSVITWVNQHWSDDWHDIELFELKPLPKSFR